MESFILQADFTFEKVTETFGEPISTLFRTIVIFSQSLLKSVPQPLYEKYSSPLLLTFGKLLIPENHRLKESTNFSIATIYMSPCTVTGAFFDNPLDAIFAISNNGAFTFYKPGTNEPIIYIDQKLKYTSQARGCDLNISDFNSTDILYVLTFPSSDACFDAFLFLLNQPKCGFLQVSAFLSSMVNFQKDRLINPLFEKTVLECFRSSRFELLLCSFVATPNETTVNKDTINFFIDGIGDRILPFIRCLVHVNWMLLSDGRLVFRQNSPLTTLCTVLLKTCASPYCAYMVKEMEKICESNASFIQEWPGNAEESLHFFDHIFVPIVDTLVESVSKMPNTLRVFIRELFIRTAGYFVNKNSAILVISNLLLLRFIIPPFTEDITLAYQDRPILNHVASAAASSLLSLVCETGWDKGKNLEMWKLNPRMELMYPKIHQFTLDVIACNEFEYDWTRPSNTGDVIPLLSSAAKRVAKMDLKVLNKVIHSHPYCVSLMQMIEENVFDFPLKPTQ